jgi:hypothetical protein
MVGRDSKEWRARVACRETDPETFFPVAASGAVRERMVAHAKSICEECPVRPACLEWALSELPHGVAGGLSEGERSALRRTRDTPRRQVLTSPPGARDMRARLRGEVIAAGRRALAAGVPRPRVADEFGVSRRTVDRWAATMTGPGAR